ncbi:MAG: HAMP domain-containing protein [Gammaproteobacteria bacterium]|nr:MAG: HAMP domain-containing protein [Gammaproteobacteria bacterium]
MMMGGLAASVIVAALVWQGIGHVRHQAWQEHLLGLPLDWALAQPEDVRGTLLRSTAPGALQLTTLSPDAVPLTPVQRERLAMGQTILLAGRTGVHALRQDGGNLWGVYYIYAIDEVVMWLARILQDELAGLNEASSQQHLQRLASQWQLPWHLETRPDLSVLPQALRDRFTEQGWVRLPAEQGYLFELPGQGVLQLSPRPAFEPFSWSLLISLTLVGLMILAGVMYRAFYRTEQRLRKVESVANRIARGELDARIDEREVAGKADSVGRLASVFNRMADHIQRLVAVQREMIHAVSHELRTPVARIRFGVQMIEDLENPEQRQKQLQGIDHDIQELNELIDEILTYARLEQGGPVIDFQEANIADIVNQVVEEQQSIHPDIDISARFAPGSEQFVLSEVEPRYIHRAIQNLVGNACRYASSRVVVDCCLERQTCRVDVQDDGPGIPEDQWEKVFTPFARLDDSRTRSSGGYGLGLSIVRRILYWHGGQAMVSRSQSLGGANFTLVWPRRQDFT